MSKQQRIAEAVACCSPIGVEPMSPAQADRIAGLLKALSDPIRLRLMAQIVASDELCVCELGPFDVSQPTISHHLKVLTEAGLLVRERRGTWAWFRLVPDRFAELRGFFA
jgi:ArsR family transcriptional regulator